MGLLSRVYHEEFGFGYVDSFDKNYTVWIRFDSCGLKAMLLSEIREV